MLVRARSVTISMTYDDMFIMRIPRMACITRIARIVLIIALSTQHAFAYGGRRPIYEFDERYV